MPLPKDNDGLILINGQRVWLLNSDNWQLPTFSQLKTLLVNPRECIYVGEQDDRHYYVARLNIDSEHWVSARSLLPLLSSYEWDLVSRALQLATWDAQHQFCGCCGSKTIYHSIDIARHCESCGLTFYPRISPCIMCLIVRGDECLLAHHHRQPDDMYSTLAGFVEAGESLEQTLHREVLEEVGVTVDNLRYFASQQWPFPHQLMIGFFADYVSGDIRVQEVEIADAQWFRFDQLPMIPPPHTLSGQLIAQFVAECKQHQ